MSNEPVAYLWQHCETGRTRVVMPDQIITTDATWLVVGPLYLHPPQRTEPEPEPVAICRTWHRGSVHHAELWKWTDALDALPDGEHRLYTHPAPQRTEPEQSLMEKVANKLFGDIAIHVPDFGNHAPQRTEPVQGPVAWLYTAAHEPWNRHLEWVENASGYRGDWIKTPLHTQDDTALLRQALDALEVVQADVRSTPNAYEAQRQAIIALRERLGEKAC